MPGLIKLCKELFDKDNLYDVLGTTKEVAESKLKKCYYRLSLRFHPDRVEDGEKADATRKFQALSRVYALLADEEKRKLYDETGEDGDDDDVTSSSRDWHAHWRRMFPAITEEMIKNFHATYARSEEEKEDLKAFYLRFEGNMEKVFEWMIHESEDDVERLQNLVEEMLVDGSLERTSAFSKTKLNKRKKTQRRKRAAEEAAEAEDMLNQIKKKHRMSEDASLESLFRKRAEERESLNGSFLEALEAKYGGGGDSEDGSGSKKKTAAAKSTPKQKRNKIKNARGSAKRRK